MTSKNFCKKLKNNISIIILSSIIIITATIAFVTHKCVYDKTNNKFSDSSVNTLSDTKPSSNSSQSSNKTKKKSSPQKSSKSKRTTSKQNNSVSRNSPKNFDVNTNIEARFPIDINKVTYEELIQIKGIGDALANKILSFRNSIGTIYNMDLLLDIDGIGESKLNILKDYLYVLETDYKERVTTNITVTTTKPMTKTSTTTRRTYTTSNSTTEKRSYKVVNINTASAKEISDSLLIDMTLARDIIALRNKIHYFSNSLELLYVEDFTDEMYIERENYITL